MTVWVRGEKKSVAVEVVFLRYQHFTNSHFHLLVIAESATFQMLLQGPKPYGGLSRYSPLKGLQQF